MHASVITSFRYLVTSFRKKTHINISAVLYQRATAVGRKNTNLHRTDKINISLKKRVTFIQYMHIKCASG